MVIGQSVEQAIPATNGNSSGLVEGQSAPALVNVPVAGLALTSVGQLATSPVGGSTNQTVRSGGTPTSSSIGTGRYNTDLVSNLSNI